VLVPVLNLTSYHESVWDSRTTTPPMHNLDPRLREADKFTHNLPQGMGPPKPLNRRLGGPYSRSGYVGEEKISFPYREANLDSSVMEPVA
jgi:hypothetical protein